MRKKGIQLLGTLIVISLFLLIEQGFAVESAAQKIEGIWSPNKEFFATVTPDRKITTVYKVDWHGNIGRNKKFWSMGGYFQVAWLSNDGKYLVGGYEGLNFLPVDYTKDQVMLSFFKCGELISEVRLNQLITNFSRLQKIESGYNWGKYLGLNAAGYFVVETVEGKKILFDMSTGKSVEFKSDKAGKLPNWKTYQDIMRCYEFQYPDNYFLKEDLAYDGTLIGSVLLKRENSVLLIIISCEEMADYPREEYNPAKMSFEEFAFNRARAMCSADGPDGSRYATDVVRKEKFTNPNNLNGVEFYLTEVTETYFEDSEESKIEKRTKGPIYVVPISQPDEPYRVLFFELTDECEEFLQGKEILKKIINTVKILK
ncbi:MAG: hypothetical protein L6422_02315 [Candidatus Marinimicrobia bacterium]|nr:hypothetical protein [Candidatus Neomarinimicrobiota bacterium]